MAGVIKNQHILEKLEQISRVKLDAEKISENFLELSSEQRLNILVALSEQSLTITKIAALLDATKPEVHRNITRLAKSGLIRKNSEGNYDLTTFGKTILTQIPSVTFIAENKEYFETHNLDNLETKFVQRIGALQEKKSIKGFVKVLERWKKIHENADKFIHNILPEVPYSRDIIDIIDTKLQNDVQIRSVFAEKAIIPDERREIFDEKQFQKYVISGVLERRIKREIPAGVLITDKEAAVFFPDMRNTLDLSEIFYSSDPDFRDWCHDYFKTCWDSAASFQESKLKTD